VKHRASRGERERERKGKKDRKGIEEKNED
jgi:hypothetical protein